ncbi:hypothetical protein PSHT_12376 [Puccinia striiformis]|uniref:Uncharacterized protein n=1 Tax=Puccinia striiformis TaxID=27350 RepID=A0A2S4UWX1_9BASI|nr:hypothetical protein PSHT_12376 [Puccinia striiformis]
MGLSSSVDPFKEIPFIKNPEIPFAVISIQAPMIHMILENPAKDSQKQQQPL